MTSIPKSKNYRELTSFKLDGPYHQIPLLFDRALTNAMIEYWPYLIENSQASKEKNIFEFAASTKSLKSKGRESPTALYEVTLYALGRVFQYFRLRAKPEFVRQVQVSFVIFANELWKEWQAGKKTAEQYLDDLSRFGKRFPTYNFPKTLDFVNEEQKAAKIIVAERHQRKEAGKRRNGSMGVADSTEVVDVHHLSNYAWYTFKEMAERVKDSKALGDLLDPLNAELKECELNYNRGKISLEEASAAIDSIFRGGASFTRTITISEEFQKFVFVKARGAYMDTRMFIVKGGGQCPLSKYKFNTTGEQVVLGPNNGLYHPDAFSRACWNEKWLYPPRSGARVASRNNDPDEMEE